MEASPSSNVTYVDQMETLEMQTCAEFLAYNLSWADLEPFLGNQTQMNQTDACGFRVINATLQKDLPVKYVQLVTYPILLFLCTVGNTLTLIVLSREGVQSVKWIFLMALAFSDLMFMWSQFFPYIYEVSEMPEGTGYHTFLSAIGGACTFVQEMFITSSDWILVAFSIERFVAVLFPIQYHMMSTSLSKSIRAFLSIVGIFILAALNALFNLFDYYWFYYNDDKRCPPVLIRPPEYLSVWSQTYQMSVLIIPLINFVLIITLNTFVTFRLVYYRKFRREHAHVLDSCSSQSCQASRMLFATAGVYCLTQTFPFVFNALRLMQQYPHCAFFFDEESFATFSRSNAFLVNINYSINFLLYSFVSTNFRQILWEVFTGKPKKKAVRWYHAFTVKRPRKSMQLHNVEPSAEVPEIDQKRASIDTQMSTVESTTSNALSNVDSLEARHSVTSAGNHTLTTYGSSQEPDDDMVVDHDAERSDAH